VVVGRPRIGLRPALFISLDPRGIPADVADEPVAVDGIAGAEDEAPKAGALQAVRPPPSKVEEDAGADPIMPELEMIGFEH
jgi:hypothetical protein